WNGPTMFWQPASRKTPSQASRRICRSFARRPCLMGCELDRVHPRWGHTILYGALPGALDLPGKRRPHLAFVEGPAVNVHTIAQIAVEWLTQCPDSRTLPWR